MNLILAAIQPENRNDSLLNNLDRAESYVDSAAKAGAQLVLCPEFLATGYIFEASIWEMAECGQGLTVEWLRAKARQHGIYIGATFLELRDGHFINTFVLMDSQGKEAGRVYKDNLPFYENYFCKSVSASHIIETDFGKIGVGICFENQRRFLYNEFAMERPDLILMPHSAPAPLWNRYLERIFTESVIKIPQFFSNVFGVPVILSNKSGQVTTKTPLMPGIRLPLRFVGASAICTPESSANQALAQAPGMIFQNVEVKRQRRFPLASITRSYSMEVDRFAQMLAPVTFGIEGMGRLVYQYGSERKQAARRIAIGHKR